MINLCGRVLSPRLCPVPVRLPQPCTVRHLVESYLDVGAVPRRSFFELMSTFATNELEREKLLEFSSAAGQAELHDYCNRPRRTALEVSDCRASESWCCGWFKLCLLIHVLSVKWFLFSPQVLSDFPHTTAELKVDYVLDLFPEIQPRSFSIASALQVAPPPSQQQQQQQQHIHCRFILSL